MKLSIAVSTLTLMLATLSAQAATAYDAVSGFSTTANTASSTWSYRTSASTAHDGNYTLLPTFGVFAGFTGPAAATSGWTASGVPAIGVNSSGADQYFIGFGPGAQFTWAAGTMFMHPGAASLVVVSWLASSAANLNIDFRFNDMDANANFPDGVAWAIEKNSGAATLAAGSFANGGDSGLRSLTNIVVQAGDRIHFVVGGNGDFQGDSTRLSAVITASPVPEPATPLLLAGGLAALAARRRFKTDLSAR